MSFDMEELLPIVAQLAEQYTGYESTSVSYERAETLMGAVIYCIDEYDASCKYDISVRNLSAKEVYKAGSRLVQKKVEDLMRDYETLMQDFCDYGNHALSDTIRKGIPAFLKHYDVKYAPQDTILTLDYPILEDLHLYSGIDRVYQYVKDITLEQKFLKRYDNAYVMELLNAYSDDYAEMLENIPSIVYTNTIGHILAGKPITSTLGSDDYEDIYERFASGKFPSGSIRNLADKFLQTYYAGENDVIAYLNGELPNILYRIENALENHCLENVIGH